MKDEEVQDLAKLLSPRELEVLTLVLRGMRNKEVADHMEIGLETVKTHLRSIFSKLHASGRTQAAVIAFRCGLDGENSKDDS